MSTSPAKINIDSENNPAPAWKQEVNRRLEAHKSRKAGAAAELEAPSAVQPVAATRAAQAAARVAARFAKAPSYSELLAEEARSAVRAAEAATLAALEAQAAAESVLAGIEAASIAQQAHPRALELAWKGPQEAVQPSRDEELLEPSEFLDRVESRQLQVPHQPQDDQPQVSTQTDDFFTAEPSEATQAPARAFGIRWDADLPIRPVEPVAARASRGPEPPDMPLPTWWEPGAPGLGGQDVEAIEPVEPARPIQRANLLEFPREIVATRKVRPRLAEGRYAVGEPQAQLSIFEVDPDAICIEPSAAGGGAEATAPAWQDADWSSIELDPQPLPETAFEAAAAGAPALELASFGWRSMAALVDGSLVMAAFLGAALVAVSHMKAMPPMKQMELISALALLVLGALYQALFFTLGQATPGMKYARISLCTFDDQLPTRAQLRARVCAVILSVLPLGLGMAWSIFDEDHLSWHDRLSRTYQRRC